MAADNNLNWYAVRTRQDFRAEGLLARECDAVFFPKEQVKTTAGTMRTRAAIPHVLFVRTTRDHALDLERRGREPGGDMVRLWIYRNVRGDEIQRISPSEIRLLQLLTARDTTRCEIYGKTDFKPGVRVRVTGGCFEGYTGTVKRVRKNKHVIVSIEGICMIMLPYIHPDLLEEIE